MKSLLNIVMSDPGTSYKATRFDWTGVFERVTFDGKEFAGRWFDGDNPLKHDNLIACPLLGNKPTLYSYTWDEQTCLWAWDASTKVGDMPDMATLLDVIENDRMDGAKTTISGQTNDYLDWLRAQSYNNGADNALTVDLYGTHRDEDAVWPGCYQK